jgi:hypothetical protein
MLSSDSEADTDGRTPSLIVEDGPISHRADQKSLTPLDHNDRRLTED